MSTAIKSYRPTVYYKYNVISVSLFIFVICMLVVSSQGWSGSDTCDGQMIQNLNKTRPASITYGKGNQNLLMGIYFLFSKAQSHRIYTDNFFIVVLEFHPMLQSWIITLYQTRSIFPIYPQFANLVGNGTRTTATIYTTLE